MAADPSAFVERHTDLPDRIRAALAGTTQGPWEVVKTALGGYEFNARDNRYFVYPNTDQEISFDNPEDTKLITAAPALLVEAIARIEELESEVDIWSP